MSFTSSYRGSARDAFYRTFGTFRKSYGPEFKFVYDAFRNAGVSSLVGPDVLFNYQAQLYDGDTLLPLNQPLITDSGLASGEGYTNAFAGEPAAPEIVTLTAQDYVLQCFDGGSISCSYGTATPDNPLSFTATAGDVTFTPTGVGKWMLTAGSYVHDYIPPGTTQASMIGSTDNGPRVPIEEYVDGVLKPKQQALRNLFRGTPQDGNFLLYSNDPSGTAWQRINSTVGQIEGGFWEFYVPDTTVDSNLNSVIPNDVTGFTTSHSMSFEYRNVVLPPEEKRLSYFLTIDGRTFLYSFDAYINDGEYADIDGTAAMSGYMVSDGRIVIGLISTSYAPESTQKYNVKNFQFIEYNEPMNLGKIVCVGDSISTLYPDQLQRILPNSTIVNAAVGGDTIQDIDDRFEADVSTENPDVIIIQCGANSIGTSLTLAELQSQFLSVLAKAEATTARTIIIGENIPRTGWSTEYFEKQQAFNAWLHTLGYTVAPLFNEYLEPGTTNELIHNFTSDGVHPSSRNGFNWMAELYAEALGWVHPAYVETTSFGIDVVSPQPMTLCTTVKMGVGSDDIALSDTINILSCSDSETVPIYAGRDATGSFVAMSDGINTTKVYTTWDRQDTVAIVGKVLTATTMKVGFINVTDGDTSITYGDTVTYQGFFSDLSDQLVFAYSTEEPIYGQQIQCIDGVMDDVKIVAEVLKNARA